MTYSNIATQLEAVEGSIKLQEKSRNTQKVRVQLDLTLRAMNLLNELKDKTDAVSNAEVIREALKLYDGLITEVERGSDFLIRDKEGNLSTFKIFL